jgi:S-adenosylmethionine:tRNA ribosyltransferase-isomerase
VRLSDFDYELPPELIAQAPAASRDEARLLVHHKAEGTSEHRRVRDLPVLLRRGDLLVLNDTRVLPARLFARRASGGRVELLLTEPDPGQAGTWRALAHPARRLHAGERLALEGGPQRVHMLARARAPDGSLAPEWQLAFEDEHGEALPAEAVLEELGQVPLPPYVTRAAAELDRERYQTVYARQLGAVAAPTAGLHFTPELLEHLEQGGIARATLTLHVGPGTFRPVKCAEIEQHRMHAERFELPAGTARAVNATRAAGGRVVAVGTTVVRALESSVGADGQVLASAGRTDLFLYPGCRFRAVDALLTNFHLPRSTLLMLVCAFAGRERVLELYRLAVEQRYRFYSYGDALLVLP